MKILVVSDTHGKHDRLFSVFRKEKDFDAVLHLGDLEGREDEIRRELDRVCPLAAFKWVPGNCDFSTDRTPYFVYEEPRSGLRILLTHGHRYHVGSGTDLLLSAAKTENCDMAFFGHTHQPYLEEKDGVLLYNPGSISSPRGGNRQPSYGVLTIPEEGGKATVETRYVK